MSLHAIIVAAGAGERAGSGGPKQWRALGGKAVARWSAEAFLRFGARTLVVIPADDEARAVAAFDGLEGLTLVPGGPTRTASVRAGLAAIEGCEDDIVLIHDAARPFLAASHIAALVTALESSDGALPALAVADTLKRCRQDGFVETAARDGLWRAQTPQAFRFPVIRDAYAANFEAASTDDAALVEAVGGRVALTPGDPMLMKLTYPEDFTMAESLLAARRTTRVGSGFDVHAFGHGEAVWLCGVKIAHEQGLVGHSDADVGLHALTDAILGAIGEGDIGDHFPPSDEQWRGADSSVFLRHAGELVRARNGVIDSLDVTLICESPKINPHRQAMRERVAEILDVSGALVSVKATTTEQLGFTGRREGIAAQAIAAVSLDRP